MSRWLAVLLYLAVAALVGVALWYGWGTSAPERGRFVVELSPGEQVDYALGPEVERLRLVSGVVLPEPVPDDGRLAQTYPLDIRWISPGGDVRREDRIWERTRLSRWPGATGSTRRPASRLDDGRVVTDPRTTELPGAAVLPGGGVFRVSVPDDSEPVVLRVFGARKTSEASTESAKVEEIRRAARRVGYPDLDRLESDERIGLLDETWRSLPFAAAGQEGRLQRLRRDPTGLVPREETVAGAVLGPGQAIAVTVVGPARVRIDGRSDLDDVAFEAVGDLPADAAPPRMTWRAAQPSRLLGSTQALVVELNDPVVTSLVLSNPTNDTLGPFVTSLLDPARERLHGWTPAGDPDTLLDVRSPDWALIGPERVEVPGVRLGSDLPEPYELVVPLGNPVVRFDVRPELEGPDDVVPREVTLQDVAPDGTVLREETYEVSAWPAPFERRAEDGGWVGEPARIEVEPRPGVQRLRMTSAGTVRVMAMVEGPPRGRDWYRLDNPDDRRVRYAKDPPRRWWRRWPSNTDALVESRQLASVLANVRLEPRGPSDDEGVRHYAALRPIDGLTSRGRTWLLPGAGAFGLAWCPYPAGAGPRAFEWDSEARSLRHGELRGMLHTPSRAAIGQGFRVELDGATWRQGRITQRVERVAGVQEPSHRRARLVAPAGSVLWLRGRTGGDTGPCHRGVQAWPIRPGGEARLPLEDTWEGRRIVLTGLADAPVTIQVAIEGLGDPFPGAEQDEAFVQEIVLRPGDDLGQRLDDPDVRLPVLDPERLRIGAEVPSLVLRVRHVDGPSLWLRAQAEVDQLRPPPPPTSARVRGGP